MNPLELVMYLGMMYDGAYYYIEKLRQTIQTATIGKRDMVCLTNGCWLESSYNIPSSWITWKYNSERHELVNSGIYETEPLGWLSVVNNTTDISPFFVALRCESKDRPSESTILSLFALQSGWMPQGTLTIILDDASEKVIECESLFSTPGAESEKESL